MDMHSTDIISLYGRFMQAVWIDGRVHECDLYFAPDAEIHGVIAGTQTNLAETTEAIEQISLVAKVRSFEVVNAVDNGAGKAALYLHVWVEAQATGVTAMQEAAIFLDYADGKITRSTTLMDQLGFVERAGMLPEGALMRFMTGDSA